MEKEALFTKQLRVAMAALIAAVVALTLTIPAPAFAASLEAGSIETTQAAKTAQSTKSTCAKAKTIKKHGFTCDTKTIKKAATKVKKGTNKLNLKGGQGYLKFTASKTKKYSFKFSGLTSPNYRDTAFVEVQKQDNRDSRYSFMVKVKTKGGTSNTLWLCTKGYNNSYYSNTVSRPLTTRTGSIKLYKGEDVYFYFHSGTNKTGATLKIS